MLSFRHLLGCGLHEGQFYFRVVQTSQLPHPVLSQLAVVRAYVLSSSTINMLPMCFLQYFFVFSTAFSTALTSLSNRFSEIPQTPPL